MPLMKRPKLLYNIAALGSVQATSYLIPLITLPYLTRTLGVEAWGELALAQVIIGYFSLVTSWGFSWSATRKIAAARDNGSQLARVFAATWSAQWVLASMTTLILLALVVFVPFFQRNTVLYLWGICSIISGILFPGWFFNGLERMKEVAIFQVATRVVALPFIFLLISNSNDAPRIIAINAVAGLLGGVASLYWIKKNFNFGWAYPKSKEIWAELKEGGAIFASTVWIGLYTTLTPSILGMLAGPVAVGYYTLADRARQAAQSALVPVSQALFPRLSHLFKNDPHEAHRLLDRSGRIIVTASALLSILLWLAADPIVHFLGGVEFKQGGVILRWLAPLPLLVGISNIFGVQVMLPNHKTKAFNRILGLAGALSLCMIVPLIQWKGAEGAAINTLVTECFVSLAMGGYLMQQGFFSGTKRGFKK